jgi:hypothetical protein
MATNKAISTKSAAKRVAPKPTSATGSGTVATTKVASGTTKAQAAVAQAPLFTAGTMPPVRPGTHRAYAQQVARSLSRSHKKGFTLAQFKAALISGAAASTVAPPRGGWQAHNMPTWMSNNNQKWLVTA